MQLFTHRMREKFSKYGSVLCPYGGKSDRIGESRPYPNLYHPRAQDDLLGTTHWFAICSLALASLYPISNPSLYGIQMSVSCPQVFGCLCFYRSVNEAVIVDLDVEAGVGTKNNQSCVNKQWRCLGMGCRHIVPYIAPAVSTTPMIYACFIHTFHIILSCRAGPLSSTRVAGVWHLPHHHQPPHPPVWIGKPCIRNLIQRLREAKPMFRRI